MPDLGQESGLTSNKPTHYLLDYGDFLQLHLLNYYKINNNLFCQHGECAHNQLRPILLKTHLQRCDLCLDEWVLKKFFFRICSDTNLHDIQEFPMNSEFDFVLTTSYIHISLRMALYSLKYSFWPEWMVLRTYTLFCEFLRAI